MARLFCRRNCCWGSTLPSWSSAFVLVILLATLFTSCVPTPVIDNSLQTLPDNESNTTSVATPATTVTTTLPSVSSSVPTITNNDNETEPLGEDEVHMEEGRRLVKRPNNNNRLIVIKSRVVNRGRQTPRIQAMERVSAKIEEEATARSASGPNNNNNNIRKNVVRPMGLINNSNGVNYQQRKTDSGSTNNNLNNNLAVMVDDNNVEDERFNRREPATSTRLNNGRNRISMPHAIPNRQTGSSNRLKVINNNNNKRRPVYSTPPNSDDYLEAKKIDEGNYQLPVNPYQHRPHYQQHHHQNIHQDTHEEVVEDDHQQFDGYFAYNNNRRLPVIRRYSHHHRHYRYGDDEDEAVLHQPTISKALHGPRRVVAQSSSSRPSSPLLSTSSLRSGNIDQLSVLDLLKYLIVARGSKNAKVADDSSATSSTTSTTTTSTTTTATTTTTTSAPRAQTPIAIIELPTRQQPPVYAYDLLRPSGVRGGVYNERPWQNDDEMLEMSPLSSFLQKWLQIGERNSHNNNKNNNRRHGGQNSKNNRPAADQHLHYRRLLQPRLPTNVVRIWPPPSDAKSSTTTTASSPMEQQPFDSIKVMLEPPSELPDLDEVVEDVPESLAIQAALQAASTIQQQQQQQTQISSHKQQQELQQQQHATNSVGPADRIYVIQVPSSPQQQQQQQQQQQLSLQQLHIQQPSNNNNMQQQPFAQQPIMPGQPNIINSDNIIQLSRPGSQQPMQQQQQQMFVQPPQRQAMMQISSQQLPQQPQQQSVQPFFGGPQQHQLQQQTHRQAQTAPQPIQIQQMQNVPQMAPQNLGPPIQMTLSHQQQSLEHPQQPLAPQAMLQMPAIMQQQQQQPTMQMAMQPPQQTAPQMPQGLQQPGLPIQMPQPNFMQQIPQQQPSPQQQIYQMQQQQQQQQMPVYTMSQQNLQGPPQGQPQYGQAMGAQIPPQMPQGQQQRPYYLPNPSQQQQQQQQPVYAPPPPGYAPNNRPQQPLYASSPHHQPPPGAGAGQPRRPPQAPYGRPQQDNMVRKIDTSNDVAEEHQPGIPYYQTAGSQQEAANAAPVRLGSSEGVVGGGGGRRGGRPHPNSIVDDNRPVRLGPAQGGAHDSAGPRRLPASSGRGPARLQSPARSPTKPKPPSNMSRHSAPRSVQVSHHQPPTGGGFAPSQSHNKDRWSRMETVMPPRLVGRV